jgi:hypothetical protein
VRPFTGAFELRKMPSMKPHFTIIASLAFASGCLIAIASTPGARAQMTANGVEVITNGPQTSPGDASGIRPGPQNVRDSDRYESLVHSNPNFRAARERKECGSIDDPQMRADCVASFGK